MTRSDKIIAALKLVAWEVFLLAAAVATGAVSRYVTGSTWAFCDGHWLIGLGTGFLMARQLSWGHSRAAWSVPKGPCTCGYCLECHNRRLTKMAEDERLHHR